MQVADILLKSPSDLYENGDWYVILSVWVDKVNKSAEQNWENATPEMRSKYKLTKRFFLKGEVLENEEKAVKASEIKIYTLDERLNRQYGKRR
jgi:heme-degrading monooxygenase HmoA